MLFRNKLQTLILAFVLFSMAVAVTSYIMKSGKYNFPVSRKGRSQSSLKLGSNFFRHLRPSPRQSKFSDFDDKDKQARAAEDKQMELLSQIFQKKSAKSSKLSRQRLLLQDFGTKMAETNVDREEIVPLPQLSEVSDRQFGNNVIDEDEVGNDDDDDNNNDDDEIRCIPKVMQVEELVYDRGVKCHHTYRVKCHTTYITDYVSSTEEKCDTTFRKICHIVFKPVPFNETVSVCNTPVVRQCGDDLVGPEVCSVQYETTCETKYKSYNIEQDEPVCKMEIMQKCRNITFALPQGDEAAAAQLRSQRQFPGDQLGEVPTETPTNDEIITIKEKCEEWPVKKCQLEKKIVTKVHPDTACRKIPREVCVPNNCKMAEGEKICRDENRVQIQNVPEEECELQPQKNCRLESVLVPKLAPKNNCMKIPKEVCVKTKKNPRRVMKPVIKEWCYRPSDLRAAPPLMSSST